MLTAPPILLVGPFPGPREMTATAYDAARRQVVLFGGYAFDEGSNMGTTLADTWTFQGRRWTRHELQSHPEALDNDLMVYDERLHAAVLVGRPAASQGHAPALTWSWDGTAWTRLPDVPLINAEFIQGFASDRAHGQDVLLTSVSTANGPVVATHTWTFDGRSWLLRQPPQALPVGGRPPSLATIGPDAPARLGRGVIALIGGAKGDAQTWLWDGTTWSELAAGSTPPYDPSGATMAFDVNAGVLVLIGLNQVGGTTWVWDGSTWSRGGTAPDVDPLYSGTSVLSDEYVGHVIVIGDSGRPNRFDVLWTFDGKGWVSDRSA